MSAAIKVTCPKHPKYQGLIAPRGAEPCHMCYQMFLLTNERHASLAGLQVHRMATAKEV